MSGDRIVLTGVRGRGFHGVFPDERRDGQEFVVDVELTLPLAAAAATDRVAATVHYGELAEAIVAAIEGEPLDLIEALADRIAGMVLNDPRVDHVAVTVHKPSAPITVPFGDVSVRLERSAARHEGEHVVIALGANEGDREAALDGAVAALHRLRGLVVEAASPTRETVALTPSGPDPSRPPYANRVVVGRATLPPHDLLTALLGIETAFGRVRAERWGDRTLDLDLIAYGDRALDEPGLALPHPRAHERDFVLLPWLEVEPEAVLPGHGPVRVLATRLRP